MNKLPKSQKAKNKAKLQRSEFAQLQKELSQFNNHLEKYLSKLPNKFNAFFTITNNGGIPKARIVVIH